MQHFLIETGLLLIGAFIIGCVLGCILRSTLHTSTVPKKAEADDAPAQPLVSETVLEEEDDGEVISAAHGYTQMAKFIDDFPFPVAAAVAAPAIMEIISEPEPEPEPVIEAAPEPEPEPQIEPIVETVAIHEPQIESEPEPELMAEPEPEVAAPVPAPPVEEPVAEVASAAAAPEPVAPATSTDNLTLIKGIDNATAESLAAIGIVSFEQIANLLPEEVNQINEKLTADARVQSENWIEQAKILAVGGLTDYAHGTQTISASANDNNESDDDEDSGPGSSDTGANGTGGSTPGSTDPGALAAPEMASAVTVAAAAGAMLTDNGAHDPLEVEYEERQYPTFFGDLSALMPTPRPGPRRLIYSGDAGFSILDHELEDFGLEYVNRPIRRKKLRRSPDHALDQDDLKKISSIGVVLEKKLNGMGVTRYEHIAFMPKEDLQMICNKLNVNAAIDIDSWSKQAFRLSEGEA